jgi:hypothetical protein
MHCLNLITSTQSNRPRQPRQPIALNQVIVDRLQTGKFIVCEHSKETDKAFHLIVPSMIARAPGRHRNVIGVVVLSVSLEREAKFGRRSLNGMSVQPLKSPEGEDDMISELQ